MPKQFLKIGSDRSLLRETVDRVAATIPVERLWIVTGQQHEAAAAAAVPELPQANLLIEPAARNTAACIAWATEVIAAQNPSARVAVLPADHHIRDDGAFRADLDAAFDAADAHIVLFGIAPDAPETGYGYIQCGERAGGTGVRPVYAVERFVEKPDRSTAERYLESGDYVWNSGMFVFTARVMRAEIAALMPELARGIQRCMNREALAEVYPTLPSVSIDYGVMEHSNRTQVIVSRFGWSDVGSWDAAMDVYSKDDAGNVVLGDGAVVDVEGSFVKADAGRTVAVVGLDDVIVVDTKDALLVVRRGHSQSVKKVVELLRRRGQSDLL